MSGYTVKPPTGDTNEQTQFIDYFNLFYSKRGQEQISISQQLGNYGTTFFSASRQSYWNTSRSDQQISFGLNVPFGDITTSLNYSYSNNIWQNDRDHLLAFTLNVPFSHWMRTDSQSAFRNSNASYSMSNDLKGGMTNLSGVYGTLLPDNNLNYSVQVGNTHGGNTSSGTSGYSSLNYRGAYGNTNVGYSRSGDSSQIYYGMSGGIIAHADGITFGQPLGDTMVLVKAPGADNVKIAWEVTDKQVNASFFAENTVQSLLTWGDHELEAAGRLTQPLKYDAVSDCYKPLSWQQAFDEIGARLQSYSDPNQVEFYTSGRTSNEAAFLYQLFAREYGSNNFPDCSNMCHEPTSVGLAASIGVGKGTVLLEDFEKCDLVICIGHNPGTNHPRMLTSLRALVKRGAKMIAINPLQERGLERFTAPQNPFEMLTNSETQLASAYYNVRIGGDMALLKGMMRLLIERDDAASAAGRPSLLDDEFIQTHTVGFDELRRDVLNSEWKDIERISGLSQTQIAELADAYAAAERTIICYGMGITQHEHGTQNVQQLVNLLLMKGNIGKPGAGICPLRGHSNVQGDRTVGITEKPSAEFLARLGERYGFTPPHAPGHAAIASMQAICTGQARALICMGGNFALAMPDREASAVPLTQLDLAVHVATKLNRSHLLTARHSYILPVLGRSEIDMQKNGAQAVTVEDSMSMIHASRGVLKPAGVMLKSECAVVAGIAQAALPQSVVAWEYLVEDYDRIRNDIEAVLPEFADYNQRIRHPGGFHLINAAAERRWMTPSGKANFITSKGLLEDPSSAFNSKLVMATVRSHDQYNTTIYGMDDRYRGVFGQRDVVFMSAKQAKICRVKNGERVNLIALTPDGKRSSRRMDRLKVVIYPMADRSLVTYFPESNHMLTLDNHDPLSGIPGYKSIPVELEPSN